MDNIFANAAVHLGRWTLSAALLWGGVAQAQVSISPLVIETEANRGQAQGIIDVSNSSSEPFRARVYAEPFTYSRDTGFTTLTSSPNDLTPYLQFSPRELVVQPGVTRRVRLIAQFPPNLPPGEYRAVVFTENLREADASGGSRVAIQSRVGVTVYVRQGEISPDLVLESASWNQEQRRLQLLVSNQGKASVRPTGSWTLQQGETVVETGTLEPMSVIAESDRYLLLDYPTQDQPAPSPGQYQLVGELIWESDSEKSTLPFNIELTIPPTAAASSKP